MRIFLSYASERRDIAEPIAFSLRSRGHEVFLDKDDLPPGRSYDEQIQKAVEQSDVMIFLISPESVGKGRFTRTELEFARANWRTPHNRILPVMAVHTELDTLPAFLKGVTILEPHGNLAAEVSAAAEWLRGSDYSFNTAWRAAALSATVTLLVGATWYVVNKLLGLPIPQWAALLSYGVPFCAVLWFWGNHRSWTVLLPMLTCGLGIWLIVQFNPNVQIANSIDTWAFESTTEENAPSEGSSSSVSPNTDPSGSNTPLAEDRRYALEQIYQANRMGEILNQISRALFGGSLMMIAVFLGASANAPELRSARRWLISVAAGAAMSVLLGQAHFVMFEESRASMIAVILGWMTLAGGLLGYWLARGHAT